MCTNSVDIMCIYMFTALFSNWSVVFWRGYVERFISALVLFVMIFTTVLPPTFVYAEPGTAATQGYTSDAKAKDESNVTGVKKDDTTTKACQCPGEEKTCTECGNKLPPCKNLSWSGAGSGSCEKPSDGTCTNSSGGSQCTIDDVDGARIRLTECQISGITTGCGVVIYGDNQSKSVTFKDLENIKTDLAKPQSEILYDAFGDPIKTDEQIQSKIETPWDRLKEQLGIGAGAQDPSKELPTDTGFVPEKGSGGLEEQRRLGEQASKNYYESLREQGRFNNLFGFSPEPYQSLFSPSTGFGQDTGVPTYQSLQPAVTTQSSPLPSSGFGDVGAGLVSPLPIAPTPSSLTTTGQPISPSGFRSLSGGPRAPYSDDFTREFFGGGVAPPIVSGPELTTVVGPDGKLYNVNPNGTITPGSLTGIGLSPTLQPFQPVGPDGRTISNFDPLADGLGEIAGQGGPVIDTGTIQDIANGRPNTDLVRFATGASAEEVASLEPNQISRIQKALIEEGPVEARRVLGEELQGGSQEGRDQSGFIKAARAAGDDLKNAYVLGVRGVKNLGEALGLRTPDPTKGDITAEDLGFDDPFTEDDNPTGSKLGTSEHDIRGQILEARIATAETDGEKIEAYKDYIQAWKDRSLWDRVTSPLQGNQVERRQIEFDTFQNQLAVKSIDDVGLGMDAAVINSDKARAEVEVYKAELSRLEGGINRPFIAIADRFGLPLPQNITAARARLAEAEANLSKSETVLSGGDFDTGEVRSGQESITDGPSNYSQIDSRSLSSGEIKAIQQKLKDSGHDPGPIDGIWGRKTEEARQLAVARESRSEQVELDGFNEDDNQDEETGKILDFVRSDQFFKNETDSVKTQSDKYKEEVKILEANKKIHAENIAIKEASIKELKVNKKNKPTYTIPDKIDIDEDGKEIGLVYKKGGTDEAIAFENERINEIKAEIARNNGEIELFNQAIVNNNDYVEKLSKFNSGVHYDDPFEDSFDDTITSEQALARDFAKMSYREDGDILPISTQEQTEFLQRAAGAVDPKILHKELFNEAYSDAVRKLAPLERQLADVQGRSRVSFISGV
jgi:hypothetical protein